MCPASTIAEATARNIWCDSLRYATCEKSWHDPIDVIACVQRRCVQTALGMPLGARRFIFLQSRGIAQDKFGDLSSCGRAVNWPVKALHNQRRQIATMIQVRV